MVYAPDPALAALLERTAWRHLPGKHNQKDHGRGKGGVRRELANATTHEELAAAASGEAKRITGRNLEVDFAGSDLQVAKEHVEGVLQGLEKYPSTDVGYIGSYGPGSHAPRASLALSVSRDAYAVTTGSAIYFNNRYSHDGALYRRDLQRDAELHRQIPRDPRGVGLHEFGHRVVEHGHSETAADVIAHHSATAAGQAPSVHIASHISTYATTADHELAAEAFADVMVNGAQASPLSHAIKAGLDKAYASAGGEMRAAWHDRASCTVCQRGNPHHDSKGRFASGDGGPRGIRPSLAEATTTAELNAAGSAELSGILGRRVGVDMKGMDVETARAHLEGVARGAEMFPHTDLISVSTYGPGGARSSVGHPDEAKVWGITTSTPGRAGADIAFNTRISAAKMRDVTQRAEAAGLVHGNPRDITRTGSHEFGHAAAASLYPTVAQGYAVDQVRMHGGAHPYEHIEVHLSRYAGTSPDELIGEAVAQVATEGAGASALARDIVGGMQKHWDAWSIVPGQSRNQHWRHLPGKHDQSTHGHGYGGKNWRKTNDDAEAALTAANASPILETTPLGGGWTASVQIERHRDGTLVRKEFPPGDRIRRPEDQVDAEYLGSLVAHAVGVHAPAVVREGNGSVIMERVHGKTWAERGGGVVPAHLVESSDGRMFGLHDVLIGNPDRNPGNWMTDDAGHLFAVDHGLAFSWRIEAGTSSPFAGHFVNQRGDDWAESIDITPHDMGVIRGRLTELRSEFVAAGRADWHDLMMERLTALEPRATGSINRLS